MFTFKRLLCMNYYFTCTSDLRCRGLFIIDGKGIVRQITINDLPVGRSVDETLRLVKAFQFTDEHGEGMVLVTYSHILPRWIELDRHNV